MLEAVKATWKMKIRWREGGDSSINQGLDPPMGKPNTDDMALNQPQIQPEQEKQGEISNNKVSGGSGGGTARGGGRERFILLRQTCVGAPMSRWSRTPAAMNMAMTHDRSRIPQWVRAMCGSRTGGWSLPSVMSDWQRCVD
jgi:hypothetical protein